ncbi:efflux RND transporter periplasmic adaptor subunit [Exilibacterium tricleocarpae]|uniref:Efflux RND transporter periplasmic adaptor subunit n=1 Tax=Exilibacterium tricleocarpae TaxID=2591008 RepID=A0A545U5B9_9GAMM|nr:efflux RND transporter periplasmic adaptor subunit [Exilibacterium tricleocarpae]TQV84657.1 efflux RND transporter periplasmic adaptor subunit [Exilibacterium tricleocarpae]
MANNNAELLSQLRINRDVAETDSPRYGLWGGLVGLALVLAGLLYWFFSGPQVIAVNVEMARVSLLQTGGNSVLDATGYVTARRQATVSSKVTGKVLEVLVEEGMAVEEGQVVARLDDVNLRRRFDLATASLATAKTRVLEARARATEAQLNLRRVAELTRRKLTSQAELDAAQAQYDSLNAQLATRRAEVVTAEREVALRQQDLDDLMLRAPFAGVVVTKNAQPGEMISPVSAGGGFTRTGICSIVDMDSLEIEVDVNEAYIQRVFPKQVVEASLEAYPDWKIPAKVIAIVPTADRQKATVRVRIGFDQLDPRILPDMGVRVAFRGSQPAAPAGAATPAAKPEGIQVPDSALVTDDDGYAIYVVSANVAERRAVTVGDRNGRRRQVLSGLQPGESYVVEVPEALYDGAAVAPN